MRTFQDFNLAQCSLRLVQLRGIGFQYAVDDQSDRAFSIARAVDTANIDLCVAGFGSTGDDGHPRRKLCKAFGIVDAGFGERVCGQDRNRCGHIDQSLALAARGYDDFIACFGTFLGFLRDGGGGIHADKSD